MLRSIRRAVLVYHANSSLICKYSVQSPAPQHSAPFEYDRNIVYTYDTHVYCIYLERERVLTGMCTFGQTTTIHQSGNP